MKKYEIKNLKTGEVTHAPMSADPNYVPEIPAGWGYDVQGVDYDIIISDVPADEIPLTKEQQEEKNSEAKKAFKRLKKLKLNQLTADDILPTLKDIIKVIT